VAEDGDFLPQAPGVWLYLSEICEWEILRSGSRAEGNLSRLKRLIAREISRREHRYIDDKGDPHQNDLPADLEGNQIDPETDRAIRKVWDYWWQLAFDAPENFDMDAPAYRRHVAFEVQILWPISQADLARLAPPRAGTPPAGPTVAPKSPRIPSKILIADMVEKWLDTGELVGRQDQEYLERHRHRQPLVAAKTHAARTLTHVVRPCVRPDFSISLYA
jgi:hypothetical protein